MTSLFGTQYFGYILSAYGLSAMILLGLTAWILMVYSRRKRQLARLEKTGQRRVARTND
jgi:heme exporter protein CcmD